MSRNGAITRFESIYSNDHVSSPRVGIEKRAQDILIRQCRKAHSAWQWRLQVFYGLGIFEFVIWLAIFVLYAVITPRAPLASISSQGFLVSVVNIFGLR